MKLEDFDYFLPENLIAQTPPEKREESKLMILERGKASEPRHTHFYDILSFLKEDDLLVLNDTRVFPARLYAKKTTGGRVEIFFVSLELPLEEVSTLEKNFLEKDNESETVGSPCGLVLLQYLKDAAQDEGGASLSQMPKIDQGSGQEEVVEPDAWGEVWYVLAQSSRALRVGQHIVLPEGKIARVIHRVESGGYFIQLGADLSGAELFDYLNEEGEIPLPPYIDPQKSEVDHLERYQTVFARSVGAVAAPTAGLHWTPELLEKVKAQGTRVAWLTLHVGPGTFLPVRDDDIQSHKMHAESYEIPEETVALWKETRERGGRVIAVGTTALRALEAAAQKNGALQTGRNSTSIFIYPGYSFLAIDGLITNFHLPKSTLLMLVAAFHGHQEILQAYEEAKEHSYRFYSYGDAMFIG